MIASFLHPFVIMVFLPIRYYAGYWFSFAKVIGAKSACIFLIRIYINGKVKIQL